MTFRDDLYRICKEVAADYDDWNFVSGEFKNKTLKHSELQIDPGFFCKDSNTPLNPWILVRNKRVEKLCAKVIGKWKGPVSRIAFQNIYKELHYMPEGMRVSGKIVANKRAYMSDVKLYKPNDKNYYKARDEKTVDVSDSYPVLSAMMKDGISLFQKYYDLSSEDNLLRGLPAKYTPSNKVPYMGWEEDNGVMMCLVRILLGDFDFVVHYRSDDYKTIYPKMERTLDRIIAALPELKRHYAETGSVI